MIALHSVRTGAGLRLAACIALALTLSGQDEPWIDAFAAGLYAAAAEHDVALVGGDTTSGPVVVATVNVVRIFDRTTNESEVTSAVQRIAGVR